MIYADSSEYAGGSEWT